MRSVYLNKRQPVENEDFEDSDEQKFVCGITDSDYAFEDLARLTSYRDFAALVQFLHKFKNRVDEVFMVVYETLDFKSPSSDQLRLFVNLTFYGDITKYLPYLPNFQDLAQNPERFDENDLDSLLLILTNFLISQKQIRKSNIDFYRVILANPQLQSNTLQISRLCLLEQVLDCTIVRFEVFYQLFEQILAHASQGLLTESKAAGSMEKPSKTAFSRFLYCMNLLFFQKSGESVLWFMHNVYSIYGIVCAFQQQRLHKEFLECLDGVLNTFVTAELEFEGLQLLVADTWARYPGLAKDCIFVESQLMEQKSVFPNEDIVQMCLKALQSAGEEAVSEAISFFTQLLETFQMVDEPIIERINGIRIASPKIAADLCEFWALIHQVRPELFEKLSEELLQCVSTMEFDQEDRHAVELFLADCEEFLDE